MNGLEIDTEQRILGLNKVFSWHRLRFKSTVSCISIIASGSSISKYAYVIYNLQITLKGVRISHH